MFQDKMHHHYTDLGRYWHVLSEQFTGADSLLTILKTGGHILDSTIYYEYFPLSQHRLVKVFHIYIEHQNEVKHMKIVDTPYLHRLCTIEQLTIRYLESDAILQQLEHTLTEVTLK